MIRYLLVCLISATLFACGSSTSQVTTAAQTTFQAPGITNYSLVSVGTATSNQISYDAYTMVSTGTDPSESMMVLMKTDSEHDTWIIHVHGGPAGDIVPGALSQLHSRYNHIYFQQRGAGSSITSSGPDYSDFSITSTTFMHSYVSDIGFLVRHVRTVDPDAKVLLYGESWGVLYVLLYLVSIENQTLFGPDFRVDGVICDSGSFKSIKDNFEANLAELASSGFVSANASGTLPQNDLDQLHADFAFLRSSAAAGISSGESELTFAQHGTSTAFNGYILALFDYIMNMEYFSALKFNVSPPIVVSNTSTYSSPLDWALTQANGNSLRTTSLSASDYFLYENRFFAHTGQQASAVIPVISTSVSTTAERGAYNLLYPLLYNPQQVLDYFEVDFDDVPATTNVLFLYGEHDYRYRHAFNSGSSGMCALYFDHFASASDDSAGNCIIKPAYTAGHVVRGQANSGVISDLILFIDQI